MEIKPAFEYVYATRHENLWGVQQQSVHVLVKNVTGNGTKITIYGHFGDTVVTAPAECRTRHAYFESDGPSGQIKIVVVNRW